MLLAIGHNAYWRLRELIVGGRLPGAVASYELSGATAGPGATHSAAHAGAAGRVSARDHTGATSGGHGAASTARSFEAS